MRINRLVKEKPHSCGEEEAPEYQIRDGDMSGIGSGTYQLERGGWLERGTKASWG